MSPDRTAVSSIRLLDEHTANRIAAGEVVERPVSVVKELIENALDAGASSLVIETAGAGRDLIRVTDNGHGMSQADILLAIQRHATSKIQTAEDLDAITSYGFRGEALPSIASVSRMEILSRLPDSPAAVRVTVAAGVVTDVEECAGAAGTAITVTDLFYNTPARLKFLKTANTENGHIVELIGRMALARSEVAFTLVMDGREVFRSQGGSDPRSALLAVFGRDIARELRPVNHTQGSVRVSGYVTPPHVSRPNRAMQSFFVNGRPIRHKVLSRALDDAFRMLTPDSRFPAACLFVDLPPSRVDVNVHPAKAEVKFAFDGEIYQAVHTAVRQGLIDAGMMPEALVGQRATWSSFRKETPVWTPDMAPSQQELHGLFQQRAGLDHSQNATGADSDDALEQVAPSRTPYRDILEGFEILGQFQRTFIIASTPKALLVVDQHVAHERVMYEKLTIRREREPIPIQALLMPVTVPLDRKTAMAVSDLIPRLQQMGFLVEPFGPDTLMLRGAPAWVRGVSPETLVRDLLGEMTELSAQRQQRAGYDPLVATAACHMSVKAGDRLDKPEMQQLLQDLAATENPYLCPHGRPVILTITQQELERRFLR